ncbi:MAG: hypothetical protein ABIJ09_15165 [Pseudomonadota bacterium]
MIRKILGAALCIGVLGSCPVQFDEQKYYDCGVLSGKHAVACVLDDDCDVIMGSKKWTCRDRVCVKDCPDGFRCASDGYCKPKSKACLDSEFKCGAYCVAVSEVTTFEQTCCGGCGEGESCCPFYDADHVPVQNNVVCVDLAGDRDNCGTCGHRCEPAQHCVQGVCVNIGQCDTVSGAGCDSAAQQICCGGQCFDSRTSPQHCGVCDNNCASTNRLCFNGGCITGTAQNCCGATCQDCLAQRKYCDPTSRSCLACRLGVTPDDCGVDRACMYTNPSLAEGVCLQQSGAPLLAFSSCTQSATINPCQPGHACTSYTGGPTLCMRLCRTNYDCVDGGSCTTASGGWGLCNPACPCPPPQAPQFVSCYYPMDVSACVDTPFCDFAGTASLGQACASAGCTAGLTCAVVLDTTNGSVISEACARPCNADGGCSEDAGETCRIPPGCDSLGYCQ